MSAAPPSVIIVGAGFSGTIMAAQLARRGVASVLVEKAARAGQGVAYSTGDPAHLLNVPAARMSAWPDRPDDFAEAVAAAGLSAGSRQGGAGAMFLPRLAYGEYLRSVLDEAEDSGLVTVVAGEAVSAQAPSVGFADTSLRRHSASPSGPSEPGSRLRPGNRGRGWVVELADGRELIGAALVLATGNQPPEPLRFAGPSIRASGPTQDERFLERVVIDDPWSAVGRAAVEALAGSEEAVLLVGTGLTMVDMVLTLDEVGHEGPVTALSRRGLVPRAHAPGVTALPAPDAGEVPDKLSDAVAWLRARGLGVDWRAAVDSLRPISQALWARWGDDTRRRFLRHARPWWDVHRHRIAPSVAEWIRGDIGRGKLDVMAGRILGVELEQEAPSVSLREPLPPESRGRRALVRIARRDGKMATRRVAAIVNCTGPLGAIERSRDPLLRQMLGDGLVRADALGLGIAGDDRDRAGEALWIVGPLSKGQWWEITAVPDIRGQAERIAGDVAAALG